MTRVVPIVCALLGMAAVDALADAKADAQARVDRAKTLHGEGKLAEALVELKEAYVLDPRPELLFAIGQIHVGLGHCTDAITYYERYLTTNPEAQAVDVTQQAIKACKENPDTFKPPPPKEPPPPPKQPPPPPQLPPWYSDWIADGLVIGGVVVGVGAVVLYSSARGDRDAADDETSFVRYSELLDDAKRKRNISVALGVAAPALIAGGVLHWLWRERDFRRKYRDSYSVIPVTSGGIVTRAWSF